MVSLLDKQFKSLRPTLVLLYIPVLAILSVISGFSLMTEYYISDFTRDPAAVTQSSPFVGVLSNIGILAWCAAAAICFFSVAFLRYHMAKNGTMAFLLALGTITTILLVDDLFLFHEKVAPIYLHLSETRLFMLYGVMLLAFLSGFYGKIRQTDFLLLFGAFGFFAMSLLVDVLPENILPGHHLFEDGFKFFGIVTWLGYCWRTCYQVIDGHLAASSNPSTDH
jgi:hypothetical protein